MVAPLLLPEYHLASYITAWLIANPANWAHVKIPTSIVLFETYDPLRTMEYALAGIEKQYEIYEPAVILHSNPLVNKDLELKQYVCSEKESLWLKKGGRTIIAANIITITLPMVPKINNFDSLGE